MDNIRNVLAEVSRLLTGPTAPRQPEIGKKYRRVDKESGEQFEQAFKRVTLYISRPSYLRFAARCAAKDMTVSDALNRMIDEALASDEE